MSYLVNLARIMTNTGGDGDFIQPYKNLQGCGVEYPNWQQPMLVSSYRQATDQAAGDTKEAIKAQLRQTIALPYWAVFLICIL